MEMPKIPLLSQGLTRDVSPGCTSQYERCFLRSQSAEAIAAAWSPTFVTRWPSEMLPERNARSGSMLVLPEAHQLRAAAECLELGQALTEGSTNGIWLTVSLGVSKSPRCVPFLSDVMC